MINNEDTLGIIREELTALMGRIRDNHRNAGQVASGRTSKSLKVEMTEQGGALVGRSPFGTLETGRKAGRIPQRFTDIIRQWIIDKGISVQPIPYIRETSARWQPKYTPEERGLRSMAGAIATTIKSKGTRLHRIGGRADIYSNEIPETVEAIGKRIMAIFTTEVEHIHLNTNTNNNGDENN